MEAGDLVRYKGTDETVEQVLGDEVLIQNQDWDSDADDDDTPFWIWVKIIDLD